MSDNYFENTSRDTDNSYTFKSQSTRYQDTSGTAETQRPKRSPKKKMSGLQKFGLCLGMTAAMGVAVGGVCTGVSSIYNTFIKTPQTTAEGQLPDDTASDKSVDIGITENKTGGTGSAADSAITSRGQKVSLNNGNKVKGVSLTGGAMSTEDVASALMPAMVAITNTSVQEVQNYFSYFFGQPTQPQMQESTSRGTGVIIGEADDYLYIASNEHVIANSKELTVAFTDGSAASAEIVGQDATNDLSIIKVALKDLTADTLDAIRVAAAGNSSDLNVGESVIAIGNALGYGQSVSQGIVSALERSMDGGEGVYAEGLIQTDAAINPGNSGGALLNQSGELIGINSAKYASTAVEGMGYAIPIDKAYPIFEAMINGSYTDSSSAVPTGDACLGISCVSVTAEMSQYYNIPQGIYIKEITAGSGAEKAGLVAGDVITGINDKALATVEELTNYLNAQTAGDQVTVIASRNKGGSYQSLTFKVTLSSRQALS